MNCGSAGSILALALCGGLMGSAAAEGPILTPPPPAAPRINGPRIYGARPGRPFLFRIPCTGQRPIRFSAAHLPAPLVLDPASGIISGATPKVVKTYRIRLSASNAHGKAEREFRLVVGDKLALTPPMGWNDWYTHYHRISDKLMREAAGAMIASGMADFGYQYVNIDDCWAVRPDSSDPEIGGAPRNSDGSIRPNRRFPDMKALAAYIHSKGLKAGLYTSPGPLTCARYEGSYQHEQQDAAEFARWDFDFLKYDWCSYSRVAGGKSLEDLQRPYRLMGSILSKLDRDIVFNLCQYGMGDVWNWGAEVGGNCWRTTGDLGLQKAAQLPGFYNIGFRNAAHFANAGPGHWNDPDYILIGSVGNAFRNDEPPKPTSLTADEQYSYMSMWSLMASPLFFGGDMNHLDAFTLNVLCNAEVIDVNQDPLGRQAGIVIKTGEEFVLAKPMEDGSLAVGLFNLTDAPRKVGATLAQLSFQQPRRVRDLWRQRDIHIEPGALSLSVPAHGVAFVRLFR
ncbi:MAG: hypothetical protein IT160_02305 [Bryobacterales bacterium]|nr:hypothetical protein [Bryobacterales bacterium]